MKASRLVLVIGAIGLAAAVAVLATRFGTDPNDVRSPLVGTDVPALELPYLEAPGTLTIGAGTGDILVVNFWASWCIPCRAEHPVLLEMALSWADAGVRVVGIVYQDDEDSAVGFLDEYGRGYDVVTDPGGRAAISFGVFGVPETFFVDRQGKIAGVIRGPIDGPRVEAAVQQLVLGGSLSG